MTKTKHIMTVVTNEQSYINKILLIDTRNIKVKTIRTLSDLNH